MKSMIETIYFDNSTILKSSSLFDCCFDGEWDMWNGYVLCAVAFVTFDRTKTQEIANCKS